jgi:hypothetical protein
MPSDTAFTTCTCCGSTLLICSRKECGKTFPRRSHEDETSWGSRRYCSLECAAAVRQINRFADRVLAEKPCARPLCDKLAKQRRNESPASFELRKYCSHECSTAVRSESAQAEKRTSAAELEVRRRRAKEIKAHKEAEALRLAAEKARKAAERAALPATWHLNTSEHTRESPPRTEPSAAVSEAAPAKPVWRPGLWRELDEAKR